MNYYGNFLQNLIDISLSQDYHKRPSAEQIIDFINKKEIPRSTIHHHSHHNDFSNFHFEVDGFRPHSAYSSQNRFYLSGSIKSHRHHRHHHHYGRISFLGPQEFFKSEISNFSEHKHSNNMPFPGQGLFGLINPLPPTNSPFFPL